MQDGPKAQARGATARRLIGELGAYRRQLVIILFSVIISAASQAGGPWLIGRAIDLYILRGDQRGLALSMLALFFIYVAGSLASRVQVYRVGMVGQRLLASLRARLFARLQGLPLTFFNRRPVGELISRVTNDVDTINQLFSQGLTQLVGSLFGLVGIVVVMLLLNPRLALVSFAVIPVMLLITSYLGNLSRRAFRTTRATVANVTADLQEEITGVREAHAFNRTEYNITRFQNRNAANRDANIKAVAITSAFSPAIDVLSTLATAIVIGYGGYLVFGHGLTVGVLTAFLIYVQQFFRPIQLISQVYAQMQASLAGAERIYTVLDEPTEPPDAPDAATLGRIEGAITFESVDFGYDPKYPVLHEVSFSVAPGQTVALVGRTGAGKTTIASLIPRFYDVTAGAILIDGHDVRSVTRASLRAQLAIVLQEPFLFSGTIAENIAYGRPGASRHEVEVAAQAVEAHDFITALPEGYDTVLGEAGGALSQGQRQLLTFARAILANPRILILDEATSTVDTRTEAMIQNALVTVLAGRTSVVIAHRLSTIRNADLILVIDAGRIVEAGTHETLLAAKGVYAALYSSQFRIEHEAASEHGVAAGDTALASGA
ncbi:MAG: Lipid export ATP-binding/permease protein MsbA [Chloroflexi bacterium]|nr:Lipid export ATP-binding/permease protein MsbA [Chloroflexota bacterium]